jgi:cobalt-zinc-cadmium efflux system membrane fusion protein
MIRTMNTRIRLALVALLALVVAACGAPDTQSPAASSSHGEASGITEAKGPNGGRLLTSGDFELELAIFERGVPPEFHAWVKKGGEILMPADVSLQVKLGRLGGLVDQIVFTPSGDYLKGDTVIYEPHSFEVSIEAVHDGETHGWNYENFEGRTRIAADVADSLGVETALAGGAVLKDKLTVYGRIRPNPARVREVRARFEGVVRAVHAEFGSIVSKGDKLFSIESDESLNIYSVAAPIGGVITQRAANPGEQTSGRLLMTITDNSSVWAELSVFPGDRAKVRVGAPVTIAAAAGGEPAVGAISAVEVLARADQTVVARAVLENPEGYLLPGTFVSAEITVDERAVPLAVRREGLQAFRDFTVVYARVGEEYEVRILELGREAGDWAEVLAGLEPGTRYVVANSYLIKADIEKSGASHDH